MLAQPLRRHVLLTGTAKQVEVEAREAGLLDAPLFDTPPLEALLDECLAPDDFIRDEVELPSPQQHNQPLELSLEATLATSRPRPTAPIRKLTALATFRP